MTAITLLTRQDCDDCARAKEILHHLSAEFEFTVTEVDMDSETGRAVAIEHAMPFAPGLLIDGRMYGYGPISRRRLHQTLTSVRPIGG
jgi:glutaredoxin